MYIYKYIYIYTQYNANIFRYIMINPHTINHHIDLEYLEFGMPGGLQRQHRHVGELWTCNAAKADFEPLSGISPDL